MRPTHGTAARLRSVGVARHGIGLSRTCGAQQVAGAWQEIAAEAMVQVLMAFDLSQVCSLGVHCGHDGATLGMVCGPEHYTGGSVLAPHTQRTLRPLWTQLQLQKIFWITVWQCVTPCVY